MKGMKKGRDEKKSGKKLVRVVMAGIIVSAVMISFMPLVSAAVTSFTITPDTGIAGRMAAYTVAVDSNTTWTWQNTTIAAGFSVVPPTSGGVQLARIDLWDSSGYYGNVIIKANMADPSGRVDVTATVDSDTATTTQHITYAPGATFIITSPFGGASLMTVQLPTDIEDGYINVSLPMGMRKMSVAFSQFIRNPTTPGVYCFTATTSDDPIGKSACVHIFPVPVPVYNTLGLVALVGIMSVVLGFATLRRKR